MMPSFNAISRVHTRNCSLKKKFKYSANKVANWIIVDISSIFINLMLSLANSSISFVLEVVIAKDH